MSQPPAPHPDLPHLVEPPAQERRKRFGFLALGVTLAGGLLLGSCGGFLAGGSSARVASPAASPAVTVTQTVVAPAEVAPTEDPTEEAEEETEAGFTPDKDDFALHLKQLTKNCFGSAGCNLTFRIEVLYLGDNPPAGSVIEGSYRVTGGEDPVENTFEIDEDGTLTYTKEESASTSSSSKKLKVKLLDVTVL